MSTPRPPVDFFRAGDPVLCPVIECRRGAKVSRRLALLLAPRRRQDPRAERARQLDRGRADAAGAAVDEDRLARLQLAALEHVGPDGEERLGDARRLDRREALRDRQALLVRNGGACRVAAAREERADRIADRPAAHVRAERGDDAGDFETGNVGRARRRRILAEALQQIGAIDARGRDVDQDLAGGGNRIGTLVSFRTSGGPGCVISTRFHFNPTAIAATRSSPGTRASGAAASFRGPLASRRRRAPGPCPGCS